MKTFAKNSSKAHQWCVRNAQTKCAVKSAYPPACLTQQSEFVIRLNLHAALPLGVGPPELGLIEAVDALCAVLLNQTAFAASTTPAACSPGGIPTQGPPFSEPAALPPPPPPPLDVFLRDNPLSPALISDVIVIICHICKRETERMGKRATICISNIMKCM